MNGKQLRAIRDKMKLTQVELAKRLKVTASSVARMEQGVMIVTPPMGLLISFVAREAGVDFTHRKTGRRAIAAKRAKRRKTRDSNRKGRAWPRS
jgi:transcriptional regulator with XRE-family HTH domain